MAGLAAAFCVALSLALAGPAAAQQGILLRDPAVCGGSDSAFSEAASKNAESLTSAQGFAALPVLTGVAVGYLMITLPAGISLGVLERKVAIAR